MNRDKLSQRITALFGKDGKLEHELAALYARLGEFEEVLNLKKHKGWIRMSGELLAQAKQFEKTIMIKSVNPVLYEKEIMFARANHNAILLLLSIMDRKETDYKTMLDKIEEKIKEYEGVVKSGIPIR